ncbi:TMEM175 family protein [Rhodoblastus sp.]|uniref:TMEM175 family protein n=1 Tax=Rhodoblastus sp. TaxID=1962975 RepID=UPI003F9B64F7
MSSERIKAFSDGVLAIIITIMVLELHPPHGANLSDLAQVWPTFLAYVLSFLYVAIYWNNHHHLFYAVEKVDGVVLWANIHLLFWLSLLPFASAWASDTHFAKIPVALYGCVLLAAALAYSVLVMTLLRTHESDSLLHRAIGADFKGRISILFYLCGIVGALFSPWIGGLFYVAVAAIWLIPDRRIERRVKGEGEPK